MRERVVLAGPFELFGPFAFDSDIARDGQHAAHRAGIVVGRQDDGIPPALCTLRRGTRTMKAGGLSLDRAADGSVDLGSDLAGPELAPMSSPQLVERRELQSGDRGGIDELEIAV